MKKIEYHNFSSKAEAEKSRNNVRRGKVSKIKTKPANKRKKTKKSYGYKITKR